MRVYQFRHVGTVLRCCFAAACSATEARIISEALPAVKRETIFLRKNFLRHAGAEAFLGKPVDVLVLIVEIGARLDLQWITSPPESGAQ